MYKVEIYPQAFDHKVFPLYAGFYDLEYLGEAQIELADAKTAPANLPFWTKSLFARVTEKETDRSLLLCFDMVDWDAPALRSQLEVCDVYFKRSYSQSCYKELPLSLSKKIKPFGLYASFTSNRDAQLTKRTFLLYRNLARIGFKAVPVSQQKQHFVYLASMSQVWRKFMPHTAYITDWEVSQSDPSLTRVIYQSRVWDLGSMGNPELCNQLNKDRARVVRLLKRELGGRFVGGLIPTEYARRNFPDCLTTMPTSRGGYLECVRNSLVGVSTVGLMESNPCKLAEYMASNCCIVSEPIQHLLPSPLKRDANYIEFTTPEGCVEACVRLLDDPVYSEQMRQNNFNYYQEEVRPSALIRRRLKDAFAL